MVSVEAVRPDDADFFANCTCAGDAVSDKAGRGDDSAAEAGPVAAPHNIRQPTRVRVRMFFM